MHFWKHCILKTKCVACIAQLSYRHNKHHNWNYTFSQRHSWEPSYRKTLDHNKFIWRLNLCQRCHSMHTSCIHLIQTISLYDKSKNHLHCGDFWIQHMKKGYTYEIEIQQTKSKALQQNTLKLRMSFHQTWHVVYNSEKKNINNIWHITRAAELWIHKL